MLLFLVAAELDLSVQADQMASRASVSAWCRLRGSGHSASTELGGSGRGLGDVSSSLPLPHGEEAPQPSTGGLSDV